MCDPRPERSLALARCSIGLVLLATAGCATEAPPLRVRYADMDRGAARAYTGEGPLIVEFQPGDRIPVEFRFTGDYFELTPLPGVELLVRAHCFVRFSRDGIRVSADGTNFDEKPRQPGRFAIALHSENGQRTKLDVSIVTPRH